MYSDKFNSIENTIFYPGAVAHSYNPIIRKDEREGLASARRPVLAIGLKASLSYLVSKKKTFK